MFDHVLLNVSNRKESMKFYTPVLQILGKYYAAYVLDFEGNNIEAVCNVES